MRIQSRIHQFQLILGRVMRWGHDHWRFNALIGVHRVRSGNFNWFCFKVVYWAVLSTTVDWLFFELIIVHDFQISLCLSIGIVYYRKPILSTALYFDSDNKNGQSFFVQFFGNVSMRSKGAPYWMLEEYWKFVVRFNRKRGRLLESAESGGALQHHFCPYEGAMDALRCWFYIFNILSCKVTLYIQLYI